MSQFENRVQFTDRFVRGLKAPSHGRSIYWDREVRGLGIVVFATGTATYYWSRRVNKNLERHTIGSTGSVTLEYARRRAAEINTAVAKWQETGMVGRCPVGNSMAGTLTLQALFEALLALKGGRS